MRDYGTARWEGGEPGCDHLGPPVRTQAGFNARYFGKEFATDKQGDEREPMGQVCAKCGARRIDRQLGLESTPDEYVANMVAVFREVWRVLRDDGTLWINLGDSYAGSGKGGNPECSPWAGFVGNSKREASAKAAPPIVPPGCKPKDLVGIPWRVAFALQADGWYLRQDIIWAKPNPMPESVRDRCTKAHEFVFLLAKGQWKTSIVQFSNLDGERVHLGKNLRIDTSDARPGVLCVVLATAIFDAAQRQEGFSLPPFYAEEWKQRSDGGDSDFVRGLPPHQVAAAWASRFLDGNATAKQFLEELNRLRLTLGDGSDFLVGGIAAKGFDSPFLYADREGTVTIHNAGKVSKIEFSHNRIVSLAPTTCKYYYDAEAIAEPGNPANYRANPSIREVPPGSTAQGKMDTRRGEVDTSTRNRRSVWTVTTQPYAGAHFAVMPEKLVEPCILAGSKPGDLVMDPFAGSGTVGAVCRRLARRFVGVELNPAYVRLAQDRLRGQVGLPLEATA